MSFLMTWHSPVCITNDSVHCSLPSNYQNLQKVGYDIVVFNRNVFGHAWDTWCKNGTNGKRMSCSLLISHMQIFKLIDFRTMGLWIWITFFLIRTVYLNIAGLGTLTLNFKSVQVPKTITYRNLKNMDLEAFRTHLSSHPWHEMDAANSIDEAVRLWETFLMGTVDNLRLPGKNVSVINLLRG